MISQGKMGIGQLIENQPAPARPARLALDPTPPFALGGAPAGRDPRGVPAREVSLPLCVRPSVLFRAEGGRA
jgi:hypothetical protein